MASVVWYVSAIYCILWVVTCWSAFIACSCIIICSQVLQSHGLRSTVLVLFVNQRASCGMCHHPFKLWQGCYEPNRHSVSHWNYEIFGIYFLFNQALLVCTLSRKKTKREKDIVYLDVSNYKAVHPPKDFGLLTLLKRQNLGYMLSISRAAGVGPLMRNAVCRRCVCH